MIITYGLKQVGFTQPYSTVDKERIVLLTRFFCHWFCCGVCKLVRVPYDETVKSQWRIQISTFRTVFFTTLFYNCYRVLFCLIAYSNFYFRFYFILKFKKVYKFIGVFGFNPFCYQQIRRRKIDNITSWTFGIIDQFFNIAFIFYLRDLFFKFKKYFLSNIHI